MKVEARKEMFAELIAVGEGECQFRVKRVLNGEVVSDQVKTLYVKDVLRLSLSHKFIYEIDLGDDETTH